MEEVLSAGKKVDEIIKKLKTLSNPKAVEGMARFGINPEKALGVYSSILTLFSDKGHINCECMLIIF